MFKLTPPFCRAILISLMVGALATTFAFDAWAGALALHGQSAFSGLQIWRFFTYPLVTRLFAALGAGLIIWFFGSELEQMVHTRKLALAAGATVVSGGIVFALIEPGGVLTGPAILSMFVLGAFAYMWPTREVSIMGLFSVKAWIIALAYFLLSVIPSTGTRLDTRTAAWFAPVYGAVAAIVSFHLMFRQHSFGKQTLDKIARRFDKQPRKTLEPEHPKYVEKRIDEILDKIASKGMSSLTEEEKDFLLKHSR